MSKDTPQKPKRAPLRVEDFEKLMTKQQMEAFAAASRIRYATAEPEDYEIVAKYVRMTVKQTNHTAASD